MKLENLPEFALGDRWCVKIGMQFEWVGRGLCKLGDIF